MPMGGELGIKAGEYWAFRHKAKWPLLRAYVVDPGTHYEAKIRILVEDGPGAGLHNVRRAKLPCKWEYLDGYLDTHPDVPRHFDLTLLETREEEALPAGPELQLLRLQEALLRRIVREELGRSRTSVPKLAYTFAEAAWATGYSESTLRAQAARNELVVSYANSKGVIRRDELERWLDNLSDEPP